MAQRLICSLALTAALFTLPLNCSADIQYSTFIGGTGADRVEHIMFDDKGNYLVTGWTASIDFPVTTGISADGGHGEGDIFVLAITAELDQVLACTTFGGGASESGISVHPSASGDVVVVGYTRSDDFPVTANAWDTTFNGGFDITVSRFSPELGELLLSTYVGGSDEEWIYNAGMHPSGDLVLAGQTASSDYPVTLGAFNPIMEGGGAAFVTRTSLLHGQPVASTFINNAGIYGPTLAFNSLGDIVLACVSAGGFPVTEGAYDTTHNGSGDLVILRMKPNLQSLGVATYIGGSGYELPKSITVHDADDSIVVSGYTKSSDFPITPGVWDTEYTGTVGGGETYLLHLSPQLDQLFASTYCDPAGVMTRLYHLHANDDGIIATGYLYSGINVADAVVLSAPLTFEEIHSRVLIGGADSELCYSSLLDDSGIVVLCGTTSSRDFPTTSGAFDNSFNDPLGMTTTDGFILTCTPEGISTFSTELGCSPEILELPDRLNLFYTVSSASYYVRHIDVGLSLRMPDGGLVEDFRFANFVLESGEYFSRFWNLHLPLLDRLDGPNEFILRAVDVTPAPWNQPPYPPSGGSDVSSVPIRIIVP